MFFRIERERKRIMNRNWPRERVHFINLTDLISDLIHMYTPVEGWYLSLAAGGVLHSLFICSSWWGWRLTMISRLVAERERVLTPARWLRFASILSRISCAALSTPLICQNVYPELIEPNFNDSPVQSLSTFSSFLTRKFSTLLFFGFWG